MNAEWISVKKKLPKNGQCLGCIENSITRPKPYVEILSFNVKTKRFLIDDIYGWIDATSNVTYWMPLPSPPIKNKKIK